MKVYELIERLEAYDEDAEVRVALQPSWPLRAKVQSVASSVEIREEDDQADQADDEEDFVWIAVDQVSSSSENPYAPRAAWSER